MVAGLAGTALTQGLQMAGQKAAPEQMPPIRQHPGEYMVEKVEKLLAPEKREKVPKVLEKGLAQALGMGYGLTFGVIYDLLHRRRSNLLWEGTALGLATWAVGYLGWLPATRLMPRITRQKPGQVAGGIVTHILYGIATAGTLRLLRNRRAA